MLIKRKNNPFKGMYALPGGFVEKGERIKEACKREAREETGITIKTLRLIGFFDDPKRDPRGHICSLAFLSKKKKGTLEAASDAREVKWISMEKIKEESISLAFDHRKILRKAIFIYNRISTKQKK